MPASSRSTRDTLGGEQVEGRRAVLELLRAGRRQVRTVAISTSVRDDPALDEIRTLAGSALNLVAPERIDALARTDAPQGVIATAAPLHAADLDELLHAPDAFVVALDGVSDPRNLGAVARAAETAGATGLILPRHRSARITAVVTKTAAGAIEHLPIAFTGGIPTALDQARRAGCWTIGLDVNAADRSLFDLDLADQPLVLVLGSEGRGLGRLTSARCDVLVSIPMRGAIASLNVSAAAALACHEIARRRTISPS
ncbi:MAG TPA: 23S rRNA (guanosine(2251)-2'-O)-methyltransferase RlmB [Acidimicrobiia bacterium]|jgi:23S rRNA (guanosine2251-2'-O)-methyltransferase|nr:23S rRNA (guanosine(2251)-2'-O)-methyltransferase RlmB [Acidimicrobiia bacterium]